MLELTQIGDQIKNAMGGSLGFIATIIGLGAIFGAMLEHSGGAQSLAKSLLKIFGQKRCELGDGGDGSFLFLSCGVEPYPCPWCFCLLHRTDDQRQSLDAKSLTPSHSLSP